MTTRHPSIPHIIDQHTEEAAFLWLLRDNAVTEAHYDLNHLSDLENRLEAHLDGLRVAGETGWHRALENLQQFPESGEMFAAATLAFESSSVEKLQTINDIAEAHPETERGLISALGWVEQKHLSGKINGLLESQNPFWRRMGIAACAIHRVNPGKHLINALQDDNPALCCRALKAVGELGLSDHSSMLGQYFTSEDPDKRFWSAWAATLTGNRDTAPVILQSFLTEPGERSFQAAQLLFRILPLENSQYLLGKLAQQPEYLRLAILNRPGFIGGSLN